MKTLLLQATWFLLWGSATLIPQGVKAQLSPAAAEDQAIRLYERINAAPPSSETLQGMVNDILAGRVDRATFKAMNSPSLGFYKTTLKHMFNPLSNPERDQTLPLNDFSATIVGLVRDNEAFHQVLSGDVMYTGSDETLDYYTFETNSNTSIVYNGVQNPLPILQLDTENGGHIAIMPNHGLSTGQRFDFRRLSDDSGIGGGDRIAIVLDQDRFKFATGGTLNRKVRNAYFGNTETLTASRIAEVEAGIRLSHLETKVPATMDGKKFVRQDNRLGGFDFGNPIDRNFYAYIFRAVRADDDMNGAFYDATDVPKVGPLFSTDGGGRYDDNYHYQMLEMFSKEWPLHLQKRRQSEVYAELDSTGGDRGAVDAQDVMGVVTLRQMARSNFTAGTNRAAFANIMSSFFCKDMSQVHDASAPDLRIRQDISRSPLSVYNNDCRGCHAGMDAMTGAFSYLDYENDFLRYRPGELGGGQSNNDNNGVTGPRKIYRGWQTYPDGFRQVDNTWVNYWTTGPNVTLGWRIPGSGQSVQSGTGARSLGEVLGHSDAFSECMALRTFERVCGRAPTPSENDELKGIASVFRNGISSYADEDAGNPYNLRALFARVTPMCWGKGGQ